MFAKRHVGLLALGTTFFLVGCGGTRSRVDITQYLGKTEAELRQSLGQPSGPTAIESAKGLPEIERQASQFLARKAVHLVYRVEEQPLPKPLRVLELFIPPGGVCDAVAGVTEGFDTPEALLDAIGLGDFNKQIVSQDALGFNYRIPAFGLVQVHRSSSLTQKYALFNIWTSERSGPSR